jgi:hypothetical protein
MILPSKDLHCRVCQIRIDPKMKSSVVLVDHGRDVRGVKNVRRLFSLGA